MNPVVFLKSNQRLNLLLVLSWMLVIYVGSSMTAKELPKSIGMYSLALHVLEYVVLGFLLLPYVSGGGNPLLLAIVLGTLFGASDELHQLFVPGRECDMKDLLFDFVGAVIGSTASKRVGGL